MSTTDPARSSPTVTQYQGTTATAGSGYVDEDAGMGWVFFAASMLGLLGVFNLIDGIAAISNSHVFVGNAHFVFSDLNTWGWVVAILGGAQLALSVGIFMRVKGLRWIGVFIASLNAIAQLFFMPAYPFWALCLFTLDILVIYGLVAHGAKPSAQV